jgi:membrane-bound metal-dependent hydrolase YbcI (DUF457 family)
MPNFGDHVAISAFAGLLTYAVAKKQMGGAPITAGEAVGVAILSIGSGVLPDAIEPPTDPKHRKFFHSTANLGLLVLANKKIAERTDLTPEQKALIMALSAAYASHLLADSTTSAGLPLINE